MKISLMTEIMKNNQKFYLSGDFNVNLAEDSLNPHSNNLINMLISNRVCSTIILPIQVTDNSETIIDNIITNDSNHILPGIIQTNISDHYVVFSFTLNYSKLLQKNMLVYRRDKSNFNTENFFCRQLQSNLEKPHPKFTNVPPSDFDNLCSEFVTIIQKNTIEKYAPLKNFPGNNKNYKPNHG